MPLQEFGGDYPGSRPSAREDGQKWRKSGSNCRTREHAAIYAQIERDLFADTRPVDHPLAIILGGQPGVGKSRLLETSTQEFAERNVVTINGDELRYYHPQYRAILAAQEQRFAELTDAHARPWTRQLFERTIETRRNVVFEGTLRETRPITDTMRRLKTAGYQVVVRVIAAHERFSIAGIHRRYEEQKAAKGHGRWSNLQAHHDAYQGMPVTVDCIEQHRLADRIEVFGYRGHVLYANDVQDGGWRLAPTAHASIEIERNRPPTAEERRQQEAEWTAIFAMMAGRAASIDDLAKVREIACQYGGPQAAYSPAEPALRLPEARKTYHGPIISMDGQHVIQSVREGDREHRVQHERLTLSSTSSDLLKVGSVVEIRYPYDRIGIVKPWGDKAIEGRASRGIEPRGLGRWQRL